MSITPSPRKSENCRQNRAPPTIRPQLCPPPINDSDPEMRSTIERANWFDQELEVYAVVGSPAALTAYARLDGREIPVAGRRFNPSRQSIESAFAGSGAVGIWPRNFSWTFRPITTSGERKWRVIFQRTHWCLLEDLESLVPVSEEERAYFAAVSEDDPPSTAYILFTPLQYPARLKAQLRENLKRRNVHVIDQVEGYADRSRKHLRKCASADDRRTQRTSTTNAAEMQYADCWREPWPRTHRTFISSVDEERQR